MLLTAASLFPLTQHEFLLLQADTLFCTSCMLDWIGLERSGLFILRMVCTDFSGNKIKQCQRPILRNLLLRILHKPC